MSSTTQKRSCTSLQMVASRTGALLSERSGLLLFRWELLIVCALAPPRATEPAPSCITLPQSPKDPTSRDVVLISSRCPADAKAPSRSPGVLFPGRSSPTAVTSHRRLVLYVDRQFDVNQTSFLVDKESAAGYRA
ncbi:hypothetical protein LZ30DRAFT_691091 [Colletotrichum cereale]|nr:hypothetical protein LZ30DRAFT_691091 [Colletotrichum cereale]